VEYANFEESFIDFDWMDRAARRQQLFPIVDKKGDIYKKGDIFSN
jgi:hypothetical protein